MILVLEFVHLVGVPLLVSVQAELCIAAAALRRGVASDSRCAVLVRWVFTFVSLTIAVCGGIDAAAIVGATAKTGLNRDETFGVCTWSPANLTAATAMGEKTSGVSMLLGVQAFAFAALLAGVCITRQVRMHFYLLLAFAGLVGQALGPLSKPYFFFASNFFEVVSFGAMVLADFRLFEPPGSTLRAPLNADPSAEK